MNLMTLGGLSLVVCILVDVATVEIENIHRNLAMKKPMVRAILDGASQIAVPAFVSTLCICIVFVPIFFLSGTARFLFQPLAMAVIFAMLASYFLSRTVVPTMVRFLLREHLDEIDTSLAHGLDDPMVQKKKSKISNGRNGRDPLEAHPKAPSAQSSVFWERFTSISTSVLKSFATVTSMPCAGASSIAAWFSPAWAPWCLFHFR